MAEKLTRKQAKELGLSKKQIEGLGLELEEAPGGGSRSLNISLDLGDPEQVKLGRKLGLFGDELEDDDDGDDDGEEEKETTPTRRGFFKEEKDA